MPQYQTLRSVSDNHVHLICGADEAFADLPDHVRHQGPWQVMSRGDVEKLKPEYRLALARDGYALKAGASRGTLEEPRDGLVA